MKTEKTLKEAPGETQTILTQDLEFSIWNSRTNRVEAISTSATKAVTISDSDAAKYTASPFADNITTVAASASPFADNITTVAAKYTASPFAENITTAVAKLTPFPFADNSTTVAASENISTTYKVTTEVTTKIATSREIESPSPNMTTISELSHVPTTFPTTIATTSQTTLKTSAITSPPTTITTVSNTSSFEPMTTSSASKVAESTSQPGLTTLTQPTTTRTTMTTTTKIETAKQVYKNISEIYFEAQQVMATRGRKAQENKRQYYNSFRLEATSPLDVDIERVRKYRLYSLPDARLWEVGAAFPRIMDDMVLFVGKRKGANCYRIPIVVKTHRGVVIVAVEGRKFHCGDDGAKFIAIRRSFDGGRSWTRQVTIYEDDDKSKDGLNLGSITADARTDAVFIHYTLCFHHYDCNISSTMMLASFDDGATWETPRNLSIDIGTQSFAPGPGHGIVKQKAPHAGRIIICGHRRLVNDGAFTLISDDGGKTWSHGGYVAGFPWNQKKRFGDFVPDECQIVELPDGSLILNARNQFHYHCRCRIVMKSFDGGETFPAEQMIFDNRLVDSAVSASTILHRGILYFSNPNHPRYRVKLTLKWSKDWGKNWETSGLVIWPWTSAYSTLVEIEESAVDQISGRLGILYERQSYGEIAFSRLITP